MIESVVWTSGSACILIKLDTQDRHWHWELSSRLNCPRSGSCSPPLTQLFPSIGARHWPSTKAEVPARYHRVRSSECLSMILHLSANMGACIPSSTRALIRALRLDYSSYRAINNAHPQSVMKAENYANPVWGFRPRSPFQHTVQRQSDQMHAERWTRVALRSSWFA